MLWFLPLTPLCRRRHVCQRHRRCCWCSCRCCHCRCHRFKDYPRRRKHRRERREGRLHPGEAGHAQAGLRQASRDAHRGQLVVPQRRRLGRAHHGGGQVREMMRFVFVFCYILPWHTLAGTVRHAVTAVRNCDSVHQVLYCPPQKLDSRLFLGIRLIFPFSD